MYLRDESTPTHFTSCHSEVQVAYQTDSYHDVVDYNNDFDDDDDDDDNDIEWQASRFFTVCRLPHKLSPSHKLP